MNKQEKDHIERLQSIISKLSDQQLKMIDHIAILSDSVNKLAEGQLLFMQQFNKVFMPKDTYRDIVNISNQHDYIG